MPRVMFERENDDWVGIFLRDLATLLRNVQRRPRLFDRDFEQPLFRANSQVVDRLERFTERFQADWRELGMEGKAAAGLAGASLELKLHGFRTWLNRFNQAERAVAGAPRRRWSEGFTIKKALEWAKIIIGSLTKLVPGAEFISEGLDALSAAMKSRQPRASD